MKKFKSEKGAMMLITLLMGLVVGGMFIYSLASNNSVLNKTKEAVDEFDNTYYNNSYYNSYYDDYDYDYDYDYDDYYNSYSNSTNSILDF